MFLCWNIFRLNKHLTLYKSHVLQYTSWHYGSGTTKKSSYCSKMSNQAALREARDHRPEKSQIDAWVTPKWYLNRLRYIYQTCNEAVTFPYFNSRCQILWDVMNDIFKVCRLRSCFLKEYQTKKNIFLLIIIIIIKPRKPVSSKMLCLWIILGSGCKYDKPLPHRTANKRKNYQSLIARCCGGKQSGTKVHLVSFSINCIKRMLTSKL